LGRYDASSRRKGPCEALAAGLSGSRDSAVAMQYLPLTGLLLADCCVGQSNGY